MSQSKPAKAATKAKTKSSAAKKTAQPAVEQPSLQQPAVETVRIIPAPASGPTSALPMTALSRQVVDLAAAVEQAVKTGEATLHPDAVQAMMAALCKVYSGHVEAGENYGAFSERNPVTPTDVMVTASGLLKAANLAVFELGMWQSWTGR